MPRKEQKTKSVERKRILLVDDHPLMRRGQADLLNREPDFEVCSEAGTAREAMEAIAQLKPDLVLVDMALPDKDGLELIKDIQALHPNLAVLAMSMQDESLYAPRVLRAGGRGYVMKQEGPERLAKAIRTVLSGQVALSPRMSAKLLESMVGPAGQAGGGPEEKLTDRELEVLRLFGEGWSTEEIAGRLHLSPKTVEVHRGHIKEKLGLKITPEFTRFASAGLPHKAGQRASNATLGQTIVGTSPATPRSCFRLLRKFLVYHSPTAIAPVRVHLAAYVEVSIFPIGHDFAALSADDFPANSPRVQAGDNGHA